MGLDTNLISSNTNKVFIALANNQTAKERFDLGGGANMDDYIKLVYLRGAMLCDDMEVQEEIDAVKSRLNNIKNKYL
jgi:hypothetical protein